MSKNRLLTKVCMFGKLPPPVGGVTVSIKNLMAALKAKGIQSSIFSASSILSRADVAHIHYSNLLKRLIGVIVARLVAKRVIFTVHGKFLDMNNVYNRLSVKFSDGFIVLNDSLLSQLTSHSPATSRIKLPSIFKEGFDIPEEEITYFQREDDVRYLLLYACDNNLRDGEEVYGVGFVLDQLEKLPENSKLVLLDISGKYHLAAAKLGDKIVYIDSVVNFIALLRQVDIYLRPTYMDGASVAVQEALLMGVPVVASDVVDRPDGVLVFRYKDPQDFLSKLDAVTESNQQQLELSSVDEYVDFCQMLLNR